MNVHNVAYWYRGLGGRNRIVCALSLRRTDEQYLQAQTAQCSSWLFLLYLCQIFVQTYLYFICELNDDGGIHATVDFGIAIAVLATLKNSE